MSEQGRLQSESVIKVRLSRRQGIGLGSLVKKAFQMVGVRPCDGCEKRANALDRIRIKI
jgi:hypothetical protein